MDERMIREAEWAHLMHPADAKALDGLRKDSTLSKLVIMNVIGAAIIAIAAAVVDWLL